MDVLRERIGLLQPIYDQDDIINFNEVGFFDKVKMAASNVGRAIVNHNSNGPSLRHAISSGYHKDLNAARGLEKTNSYLQRNDSGKYIQNARRNGVTISNTQAASNYARNNPEGQRMAQAHHLTNSYYTIKNHMANGTGMMKYRAHVPIIHANSSM